MKDGSDDGFLKRTHDLLKSVNWKNWPLPRNMDQRPQGIIIIIVNQEVIHHQPRSWFSFHLWLDNLTFQLYITIAMCPLSAFCIFYPFCLIYVVLHPYLFSTCPVVLIVIVTYPINGDFFTFSVCASYEV